MIAIPEFKETEFSQPINQVAMPLIATRNGGEEFVSGSARSRCLRRANSC